MINNSELNGTAVSPDVAVLPIQSQLTSGARSFRDRRHRAISLRAGQGMVHLPSGPVPFEAPCMIWLPADAGTAITMQAGTRGMILSLSEVGLAQAIAVGPMADSLRSIVVLPFVSARLEPKDADRFHRSLDRLRTEIESEQPGHLDVVRHLTAILCIDIWRLTRPLDQSAQTSDRMIATRFLQMVEKNLRAQWPIARYAEELQITPERLSAILRKTTERAPLALIHARIIQEANVLLTNSSMQIADIAENLGFSDPAYFSRFYKRMTGHSPNRQRRDLGPQNPGSTFASWP
ncbi:helix-turn-helix domain-containing protein [Paracoccus sp. R86501]|uniref:helix-turn-helix domain-containing protein n=1 Tax=Paracoccus sp. R86501 TaxID=3101711 RepID=UPI00366ABFAE